VVNTEAAVVYGVTSILWTHPEGWSRMSMV